MSPFHDLPLPLTSLSKRVKEHTYGHDEEDAGELVWMRDGFGLIYGVQEVLVKDGPLCASQHSGAAKQDRPAVAHRYDVVVPARVLPVLFDVAPPFIIPRGQHLPQLP